MELGKMFYLQIIPQYMKYYEMGVGVEERGI